MSAEMSEKHPGSGFDAAWLDLREPIDHQSRNEELARALSRRLGQRPSITVLDLGCGTGSNLRATAPLLGPVQEWLLIDHDEALLAVAIERLSKWATSAERHGSRLLLSKEGKRIWVRLACADLAHDMEDVLEFGADLYTASALFDLVSDDVIATVAANVARRRAAFFTVLTYNGVQRWTPKHKADAAMAAAFRSHQGRDKGFGPAAGPIAPTLIAAAFDEAGYTVTEGDSGWRLDAADSLFIETLATGFASAVRETRLVPEDSVADWLTVRRTGALVGHTDILALPG
jgi:SAM-dependent methyltransferase